MRQFRPGTGELSDSVLINFQHSNEERSVHNQWDIDKCSDQTPLTPQLENPSTLLCSQPRNESVPTLYVLACYLETDRGSSKSIKLATPGRKR